jgi:hypothetical protein
MRLAGGLKVWWVWFCGRASCQIPHPMPYFHTSCPESCTEYRHIRSALCAFIFLIILATNSRNTHVTLYKKDAFWNIPDMLCRIAGCSDVANYTLGVMLIWYSLPNITRMIMGKTRRTHQRTVECIQNFSRESWRREPLYRPLGTDERKTQTQIIGQGVQMYGLFISIY